VFQTLTRVSNVRVRQVGEDEPLYTDIKSIRSALEMSPSSLGTSSYKKNFCCIAKQKGFRWRWHDTCCIDKFSSAELQESINSMALSR